MLLVGAAAASARGTVAKTNKARGSSVLVGCADPVELLLDCGAHGRAGGRCRALVMGGGGGAHVCTRLHTVSAVLYDLGFCFEVAAPLKLPALRIVGGLGNSWLKPETFYFRIQCRTNKPPTPL